MLSPTPAYADISAIFQIRSPILPGRPVHQFSEFDNSGGGRSPLRAMSAADLKGVEAAAILELRDDNGDPVPADLITVQRFDVGPANEKNAVREACDALGIEPTEWAVFASKVQGAGPSPS